MKKILDATQFDAYKNLARYLSNKKTVQIVDLMSGPLCTDGERILIPMVPDNVLEKHQSAIYGGIWHESAHIKRTDFDVFKQKRTPLMDTGLRLLEDIRIEYFEEKENPVARMEFEKAIDVYLSMHNDKSDEELASIFRNPHIFLSNLIATAYFAFWKKKVKALPITKELVTEIMPIANRFIKVARPGREGTQDAYLFAEEIEKKLKELIENKISDMKKEMERSEEGEESSSDKHEKKEKENKKKSKKKKKSKQNNGDKEDNAGEKEDEDSNDGEGEEESQGVAEEDTGSGEKNNKSGTREAEGVDEQESDDDLERKPGNDGNKEDTAEGGNEAEEGGSAVVDESEEIDEADPSEKIVYEKIKAILEDADINDVADLHEIINAKLREKLSLDVKDSEKTHHIPAPGLENYDKEEHVLLPEDYETRLLTKENYNKELNEVMAEVKRLERKTEPLISSKRRLHHLPGKSAGKLDPGMLYSIRNGNKRVFTQDEITRSMHTAISWLIDCSYSMTYGSVLKILEARKAVIAGAEQCHRLKIPFEVLGFSTKWYDNVLRTPPGTDTETYLKTYNRFYGLDHKVYHAFDDDFRKTKYNLALIEAKFDNCDHESVLWAARRLYQRTERRKILFVLSDGIPQVSKSDRILLGTELKHAVQDVKKVGIEVYGIGIFTDAVKEFYPEYSVIDDGKSISQAIYECLQKKIMSGLS